MMPSNEFNVPQPAAEIATSGIATLKLLSIVIPARDEAVNLPASIQHLHAALCRESILHEIIVVDDGSTDGTWNVLKILQAQVAQLRPCQNPGPHGFGRAVACGLDQMRGDAVIIMMADESDDCQDVVRYWQALASGHECVFGSRFIKGSRVVGYPWLKLIINRLANLFIRLLFNIPCNDVTNAFKAYRREVIEGCRPLLSPHFNLTVELPLKAIVRGYSWTVIPITWRNRQHGQSKLKLKEMGSRYLFICLYVWVEKYFSKGDYKKHTNKQQVP
jgi:dolichol-phosphate mannosyltransferase